MKIKNASTLSSVLIHFFIWKHDFFFWKHFRKGIRSESSKRTSIHHLRRKRDKIVCGLVLKSNFLTAAVKTALRHKRPLPRLISIFEKKIQQLTSYITRRLTSLRIRTWTQIFHNLKRIYTLKVQFVRMPQAFSDIYAKFQINFPQILSKYNWSNGELLNYGFLKNLCLLTDKESSINDHEYNPCSISTCFFRLVFIYVLEHASTHWHVIGHDGTCRARVGFSSFAFCLFTNVRFSRSDINEKSIDLVQCALVLHGFVVIHTTRESFEIFQLISFFIFESRIQSLKLYKIFSIRIFLFRTIFM